MKTRAITAAGLATLALLVSGCANGLDPGPKYWAELNVVIDVPGPRGHVLERDGESASVPEPAEAGFHYDWTLLCADTDSAGTHPTPQEACDYIRGFGADFFVTPTYEACAQIYGGPEVMTISGTYEGKEVSRTFTRTDGCKMGEWSDALTAGIIDFIVSRAPLVVD